jgi:hypothetical protein
VGKFEEGGSWDISVGKGKRHFAENQSQLVHETEKEMLKDWMAIERVWSHSTVDTMKRTRGA